MCQWKWAWHQHRNVQKSPSTPVIHGHLQRGWKGCLAKLQCPLCLFQKPKSAGLLSAAAQCTQGMLAKSSPWHLLSDRSAAPLLSRYGEQGLRGVAPAHISETTPHCCAIPPPFLPSTHHPWLGLYHPSIFLQAQCKGSLLQGAACAHSSWPSTELAAPSSGVALRALLCTCLFAPSSSSPGCWVNVG